MITLEQYFRGRSHTPDQEVAAVELLSCVNPMIDDYRKSTGRDIHINPKTDSMISGTTEGGFRLPDCAQGAPSSTHKILDGLFAGVDVYDPDNMFDMWIGKSLLEEYNLYREHPDHTKTWCHLQTKKPKSGCRTYLP